MKYRMHNFLLYGCLINEGHCILPLKQFFHCKMPILHLNTMKLPIFCRLEAGLEHWYVTGLQQRGVVPSIIASMGSNSSSLLNVQFEVNPEGKTADQLLYIQSQPVEIIYDAVRIILIVMICTATAHKEVYLGLEFSILLCRSRIQYITLFYAGLYCTV